MVDFYHPLSHKRPLEVDGDVQVHASKRLRDQQRETIPMDSAPQPQQADHEVPSITYASPDYRPPTQSYFCWIPQPDTFMEEAHVDNVGFRGSLESGWSTTSLGHWHEC